MGPGRNEVLFSIRKTSDAFARAHTNLKTYEEDSITPLPLTPPPLAFNTQKLVKYLCGDTYAANSENIFINKEFVQSHFSPIVGLHTPLMPAAKWLYNHGVLAKITALVFLSFEMIYETLVTYLVVKPRILLTRLFSPGAAEVLRVCLADTEHATKLFWFIICALWHPENDPPPPAVQPEKKAPSPQAETRLAKPSENNLRHEPPSYRESQHKNRQPRPGNGWVTSDGRNFDPSQVD